MTIRSMAWVPVVALGLFGCSRSDDARVGKEPLARKSPVVVVTAGAPTPPAPTATEPKAAPVIKATPEPAPKPTKKTGNASQPALTGDALIVKRLVVTQSIEQREPAAASELTLSDEPLYAFIEVVNPTETAEHVFVTFEQAGKSVGHVKLEVPAKSSRWRTWGKTRQVKQPGEWVAVVKTEDGRELSRKSFTLQPRN